MFFLKDDYFKINYPINNAAPQVVYAVDFARKLLIKSGFKGADKFEINLQNDKQLKKGSFKVIWNCTKSEEISIQGDEEGLRCGLYSFLHELGIEWFSPAENPVIPQLPLTIDLINFVNKIHTPDFIYRGLHICAGRNHFDPKVAQWMSYNLMNRKLTHLSEDDIIGNKLQKLGLRPDTTVHSYSLMIPDDKYFKSKPEWFALVGEERIKQHAGGQLCLSNKEMRKEFAKEVIRYGSAKPHIGVVGICPNDGYGHCECVKCRALDTAEDIQENKVNGRVADFVYEICNIVKKESPELVLGHYSYSNFSDFMDLMPDMPDNLLISFTQFHCQKHKISDSNCSRNKVVFKRMENILKTKVQTYLYDYYTHTWDGMPAPMWGTVAEDFKDWYRLGIYGFLSEVPGEDNSAWSSFWQSYYTVAKMLWNCEQKTEDLEARWCDLRYGKAANTMLEYFRLLKKSFNNMSGCFNKDADDFNRIFTPEVQKQGAILLNLSLKQEKSSEYFKLIQSENKLFISWVDNYKKRKKYITAKEIKAQPIKKLKALFNDNKLIQPNKIFFVSKASQLPDYDNPTQTAVFNGTEQLGFKITLFENKMTTLKIPPKNSGAGIFDFDNVEIFISDGKDSIKCYHFLISVDGQIAASECKGSRWNWSWKHEAKIKTFCYSDRWEILFMLDKKRLNCDDADFSFSLIRNRHHDDKWTIGGTPAGGAYFNTAKYIIAQ